MRVKKLNVNRRNKPGEDERDLTAADGEHCKWVSPSKPQRGAAASGGKSSGSSSPTDVEQQQQLSSGQLASQFHTCNSRSFYAVGGVALKIHAGAPDTVEMTVANPLRKELADRIAEILRVMKPHAPDTVLSALPRLALHIEKALFKEANNEKEYFDLSTLHSRIIRIQENNLKKLLDQQQRSQPLTTEQSGGSARAPTRLLTEEQARVIFRHLQMWRRKLVDMYGVAPWDILPNSTLAKVAFYMPATEEELSTCGVGNEQAARFGSSLVRVLNHCQITVLKKQLNPSIDAKHVQKIGLEKRGSSKPSAVGASKRRKKGEAVHSALDSRLNETPLMAPAPLLPAVDSLPTLLPTASINPNGATIAPTALQQSSFSPAASSQSSCCRGPQQQPFFARLQPQPQQPKEQQPENHMHLLIQGAGQLSKQQNAKILEAYEQEVQSLRWMLHQSQQEKLQLEMEVHRLRTELQRTNCSK
ncbi:HRDC-like [Plasmopara halstedii]|uniref:HRDC-like n=1 Tax=Plasmopara halstedii TaxID=4781 RepID=A0A0P1A5P6_PLAHL|nr:HRDC-like [Plasmopara halstedii]CEG35439.1 HRDC-like [Plasmopara halstedii]|eukprot:XP_024571808.1 HRDC-like [Plasmopara halstedii]